MHENLPVDEPGWHRRFAADLFNQTWTLLDRKDKLSADDKDEMLASALASRLHWSKVGKPLNFAIGDWQISRVYAVLGNAVQAERYGRKSLELSETHSLGPFCLGYAHEAIARAKGLACDTAGRNEHIELARAQLASIDDEHDRKLLADDLNSLESE